VLLVHLRDIGLILAPEQAAPHGGHGAWSTTHETGRVGGSGGVRGGTRRATSKLGASLAYGAGRLIGNHDLVLEGAFGAGVDVASDSQLFEGADTNAASRIPATRLITLRGSADGFSQIVRSVSLNGVVTVTNGAGTAVELGRLFARPRDLPPSCDMPIALAPTAQREMRVDVKPVDGGATIERPGLTVAVVGVRGTGGSRVARIAVGSYLSRSGLPRYTLVDWTEQYDDTLAVEGCDGLTYTERGAAPVADSVHAFGEPSAAATAN
jgi:hypothetical protein